MLSKNAHIFLVLFAGLLIGGCEKDELDTDSLNVERVIVFQNETIDQALDVVTIGNEALCLYISEGVYLMKLVNETGEELWTKPIGHGIGEQADNLFIRYLEKVIVDQSDNTFALFFGNQLLKINRLGEEVYFNPSFFNLPGYVILDILQDSEYNFIVSGTKSARAFMAKYSHSGEELFRNIYFVALPGANAFTSAVELPEGGYLFAGTKESTNEDQVNTMMIAKVDDFGEIEWMKLNEISGGNLPAGNALGLNVFGRELLALDNGNYIYVLNSSHFGDPNQVVTIYSIDPLGNILDTRIINLAISNYAVGSTQSLGPFIDQNDIGRGLIKNFSGGYTGLVNKINLELDDIVQIGEVTYPVNRLADQTGYTYTLNESGDILSMNYFDSRTGQNFNSINQLSNGKKIALGVNRSFGETARLTLTIY